MTKRSDVTVDCCGLNFKEKIAGSIGGMGEDVFFTGLCDTRITFEKSLSVLRLLFF